MSNSFVTPWTVACQAPLSMGFPRQEYWSGVPFPSPGDLPDSGMEPVSPVRVRLLRWQVDSLPLSPPARPLPAVMTASSTIVKWPFTRTQGQVHLSYGSRIQSHRWMRICVTMPFVVEDIKRTEKILSSPFVGPVITPTYSHKSVLSL